MVYRNELSKRIQMERKAQKRKDTKDTIVGLGLFMMIIIGLSTIANFVY